MTESKYQPVLHDHDAFIKKALKRKGFKEAYDDLEEEYLLVREMLSARFRSSLTQEAVAELMGTTKSAVSRLEAGGKHVPSLTTGTTTFVINTHMDHHDGNNCENF